MTPRAAASRRPSMTGSPCARVIAFYLPQFHPIPENDAVWGKGFTEWTNVALAKPLFPGHYQPRIPGHFGFYDLRVPEVRAAQAELAAAHGVEAFCYWHYWFAGTRLLDRPFREVLASGEPDFPFCLGWANQTWSGIWHGRPDKVIVEQTYPGMQDHERHFYALLAAFTDDRYLTVDGKPLFYVYRPRQLPEVERVTALWRALAHRVGLKGLYLVGEAGESWRPQDHGFDASVTVNLPPLVTWVSWRQPLRRINRMYRGYPTIYRYADVVDDLLPPPVDGVASHPCLVPNWDNTPRSGSAGLVLHESSPQLFERHIAQALARVTRRPAEHRLIFVKSWNEWAEGNHLEPDQRYGLGYLDVLRRHVVAAHPDVRADLAEVS